MGRREKHGLGVVSLPLEGKVCGIRNISGSITTNSFSALHYPGSPRHHSKRLMALPSGLTYVKPILWAKKSMWDFNFRFSCCRGAHRCQSETLDLKSTDFVAGFRCLLSIDRIVVKVVSEPIWRAEDSMKE